MRHLMRHLRIWKEHPMLLLGFATMLAASYLLVANLLILVFEIGFGIFAIEVANWIADQIS